MSKAVPYYIQKGHVYAVPILHYKMEMAAQVRMAFLAVKPDCIAVELPETMQLRILHAASRLPDISLVMSYDKLNAPIYYMCEPCDPAFEGLRSAIESNIPGFCIDLDVDHYPDVAEPLPDCYAVQKIGLKAYYEAYKNSDNSRSALRSKIDRDREMHMAKRLKELSFSYERILFISGMAHTESVLELLDRSSFPTFQHANREHIDLITLTEHSAQEVMVEYGWVTEHYEMGRKEYSTSNPSDEHFPFPPDRQKLNYSLFKTAGEEYTKNTGNQFAGYNLRNLMKFSRNYSLVKNQLMPDLFQLLSTAKGCVDHNYAYEVWSLATTYTHRRNIDRLPEIDLTIEDVWGSSKIIRFHLKEKGRKSFINQQKRRKDKSQFRFKPPGMFSICSYPPEDTIIEKFGDFLKKKGVQLLREDAARTLQFSSSIEDGLDIKETIRHWHEKKLYVKVAGKPPGSVGSVVVVFDEDSAKEDERHTEKFPWRTTWIGEHSQESDMAFYATPLTANVVGPGISRCEYGGFLMSYPPRRMYDIWSDPDYEECISKAEVLLMAAIDYAVNPLIVYVASRPPRSIMKSFARRYGKKVVYVPIGQLSPVTLNKLRVFHVLDGHDKREIAGDYIF
jgi:hypothetical protein